MDRVKRDSKYMKCLFFLLISGIFLFFVIGQIALSSEHFFDESMCEEFRSDWVRIKESGYREPVEIPGRCEAKRNEVVVVETTFPQEMESNTYLCFKSSRQDIWLYVDDELVESYSTKNTRFFSNSSAAIYVFLELKSEYAGKSFRIESQTDTDYTGIFYTMYYGDKMGIWLHFFTQYGLELVVALVMLFLGVVSIIGSIVLKFFYQKSIHLEFLGWGVLLAAIWIISNSTFRQLIFPSISVISDMAFFMVMLLPFPFLIYMDGVQGGRYHLIYYALEWAVVIDSIVCIALQVTDQKDFADSIVYMAVVCVLSIVAFVITVLIDIIRGTIKQYTLNAVGISGSGIAAAVQLYTYFHRTNSFSGTTIAIGLIFLLVVSIISTVRDIFMIENSRKQAILASESKAHFLANMSHEIRTPINAILGMDEMIVKESTEETIVGYAADIQSAGRSLLALVNDILDFSKIESGKLELIVTKYGVSSLLNDCYHLVNDRAKKKGLKLVISNDDTLPNVLEGDEIRIRQIITNLMTNAVKYTAEGTVTLSVSGEKTGEDSVILHIAVRDTGMGISEKDREKLFQSFERLEERKNRTIEGTGLGLAITKQLVDLMEGNIWVDSQPGQGSIFYVDIPQKVASWQEMGEFAVETQVLTRQYESGKYHFTIPEGRILVVDDVEMNRKVLCGLLKDTQLTIDSAASGEEALAYVRKNKYQLVFLDHMMPEMDGIETFEKMKVLEQFNNTPVIMLTANAVSGAKESYLSQGFTDYLSKPVTESHLKDVLLKYMPKDMIKAMQLTMTPASSRTENENVKTKWLDALDFLDVKSALEYCAQSEDFYKEMLMMFVEQYDQEQITTYFEQKEMDSYRVQVHALKGTAKSIGANDLSELARQVESAVKENKIDFVEAKQSDLMTQYKQVVWRIRSVILD